MNNTQSKVALVTGGTRGIGAAICLALQQKGHKVIANYKMDQDDAADFSAKYNIEVAQWDVSDFNQCKEGVEKIISKHGAIDILINNAGITRDSMLHKMEKESWDGVIDTNLSSCFNMCRNVIEKMRANNYGRIVNLASVNALTGQLGQTNYCASKAGIIGLTKSLALESSLKGITVNCIAPGYIKTQMLENIKPEILEQIIQKIPVKRLGTVEEIARAVMFLVDEEAGFITGTTLSVNGGMHMN